MRLWRISWKCVVLRKSIDLSFVEGKLRMRDYIAESETGVAAEPAITYPQVMENASVGHSTIAHTDVLSRMNRSLTVDQFRRHCVNRLREMYGEDC